MSGEQMLEVWYGEHGVDVVDHDPEGGGWLGGIPLHSRVPWGELKGTLEHVKHFVQFLALQWRSKAYHHLGPNCQDFVSAVLAALRLPSLPPSVTELAWVGRSNKTASNQNTSPRAAISDLCLHAPTFGATTSILSTTTSHKTAPYPSVQRITDKALPNMTKKDGD